MFRVTEVVKHLLFINILMYLGTMLLGDPGPGVMNDLVNERMTDFSNWGRFRLAMFYPTSDYFRPYQLVSHMFMHSDLRHLFFNMFAIFMFAPPLEATWGPKRFLFYYLFTGFGAALLHTLVRAIDLGGADTSAFMANVPVLGASGSVFGVLIGYGMLFPESRIMLLIPPIPLKAKYFVLIYAGIELFMGLGNFNTGVAHYAHLGGALFGFLLILYWRRYGSRL
ncbi:rhomboid family intramembrane serine protease [Phaeodactylibacter luteus]|uniref:Rhomboid family intramembrane serine protease n=1 Tax=Phaeodactylibacter luteus TaxID=1564516 RepID=A0A5C6RKK0_9BACT|nr:rhomboid family intramembrane serine protease [Phaeodactylibacter luteus]TXB61852.1 rhomboid family intramembrane serine protease [Phaeodactylibacter luteus]